MTPPARSGSWIDRNWRWVLPVACIVFPFGGVGIFLVILSLALGMIKTSEPFETGLERARANAKVVEFLGTPLDDDFMTSGNISANDEEGTASLVIPISGPKASGMLYVDGTKENGTWTYSRLEVVIESGPALSAKIDLK